MLLPAGEDVSPLSSCETFFSAQRCPAGLEGAHNEPLKGLLTSRGKNFLECGRILGRLYAKHRSEGTLAVETSWCLRHLWLEKLVSREGG